LASDKTYGASRAQSGRSVECDTGATLAFHIATSDR